VVKEKRRHMQYMQMSTGGMPIFQIGICRRNGFFRSTGMSSVSKRINDSSAPIRICPNPPSQDCLCKEAPGLPGSYIDKLNTPVKYSQIVIA
jgi:hypothetical protein